MRMTFLTTETQISNCFYSKKKHCLLALIYDQLQFSTYCQQRVTLTIRHAMDAALTLKRLAKCLFKVAPNSLSIPISTFIHSYTSKVKEKLSVQVCKALTDEQI